MNNCRLSEMNSYVEFCLSDTNEWTCGLEVCLDLEARVVRYSMDVT